MIVPGGLFKESQIDPLAVNLQRGRINNPVSRPGQSLMKGLLFGCDLSPIDNPKR